jgi:hypothetical protein
VTWTPSGIHDQRASTTSGVSEFAVLDSGERVMFERRTGATEAGVRPVASWAHETVETITRDVLTAVLPDDDGTDDEHPWEWLAELAQARGSR